MIFCFCFFKRLILMSYIWVNTENEQFFSGNSEISHSKCIWKLHNWYSNFDVLFSFNWLWRELQVHNTIDFQHLLCFFLFRLDYSKTGITQTVLASDVIERVFELWSDKTKDIKLVAPTLRRKSKDWLAWNQNNVVLLCLNIFQGKFK